MAEEHDENRLFGRILVAAGMVIGLLSGLCTGGGMLLSYAVTGGGVLHRPGTPAPPTNWAATAAMFLAPLQFGALPLALASVLIFAGRRRLQTQPSTVWAWLWLALGILIVAACLASVAVFGAVSLLNPILIPGAALVWLGGAELRRVARQRDGAK